MKTNYSSHLLDNGSIGVIRSENGMGSFSVEDIPGLPEKILDKLSSLDGGDNFSLKSYHGGAGYNIFSNLKPNEMLGELWDAGRV